MGGLAAAEISTRQAPPNAGSMPIRLSTSVAIDPNRVELPEAAVQRTSHCMSILGACVDLNVFQSRTQFIECSVVNQFRRVCRGASQ